MTVGATWPWILGTVLLFLAASDAGAGSAEALPAVLKDEVARARRQGITIVNVRDAVRSDDSQRGVLPDGNWALDGRAMPTFDRNDPPRIVAGQPTEIVLYVHGFKTRPADGIARTRRLQDLVRAFGRGDRVASTDARADRRDAWVGFLWRADFGNLEFDDAQASATATGPLLAQIVATLRKQNPGAHLTVVAHSLGAKVSLEALGHLCRQEASGSKIDALVLIQPAVRALSVYEWSSTVRTMNWRADETNAGEYSRHIRCTKNLVYTVTKHDSVLGRWFILNETMSPDPRPPLIVPMMPWIPEAFEHAGAIALGLPFEPEPLTEMIPDPFDQKRWERLMRLPDRFGRHGLPELDDFAPSIGPNTVFIDYENWRIPHPRVHRVDISNATDRTMPGEEWHSPLMQSTGPEVVARIWRILRQSRP